ncbi:MAG: circularly permuted type 2 ATP-grasp protein [Methyloversatilis sp.]|nr:circularly permuted type 2 ATP-grasp protein [Methyloversatilis sp.]MBP6193408.1 circularly permuted type 2 ATP-grasp protein [Methyloversatilis sp.]MBP9117661.1 circularly permuted type 2 ATP-grasp protein [Methyloversatilis sp.]
MPRQLLAQYPQTGSRYDELLSAPWAIRPHWRSMFDTLVRDRAEHMQERLASVQRQIRENGVTYNVYADPRGIERPWELDVLPLIIPPDEWQQISSAIAQRAELLNRILLDVYGPQKMLEEGLLPPALIYGHAGFLRPCHGMAVPGNIHLHLYAADLARSPDGRWWVLNDRTQAPSGAGYSLENRLVISRVFAEQFRDLRVEHLASFFATLRDTLAQHAPRSDGPPLIVLLTPGPYNETYFEHAYLARYLGFPLVEGSDLMVRDGCVWLKNLSGLRRVHVILRRLDDDFCDPLELRADSAIGVPGLVDAARRGNVLIANSLGSNLLESGALLGFLPRLCERLLGEPLAMPSLATWWCGEEAALEDAIEKLDHLVIKPAFPQLRIPSVFGQDLDRRERAALIARMRERPHHYVAQELVQLSQAPVWDTQHPRRLAARAIGLRVFACASPDGYVVMPGGLTRVASDRDTRVVAMQRGGSSKDTWVMTRGTVNTFSLLRRSVGPSELERAGSNLSSRVVENLFWFGRYCERCDNIARLLRAIIAQHIEHGDIAQNALTRLCQRNSLLPEELDSMPVAEIEAALRRAALDPLHAGSLAASLHQLSGVAFSLRERLSIDNWRIISRLADDLNGSPAELGDVLERLDQCVLAMMTLSGFALDGMTRDQGWRFLSVGRRIERLQFMSRVLRHALDEGGDTPDWLLELADSTITYRSRYMTRPQWLPVLDLLVADETNPRSIAYQALGLTDYLARMAAHFGPIESSLLSASVADLLALRAETDFRSGSPRLLAVLDALGTATYTLSEQLGLRFFSHASPQWPVPGQD